MAFCQNCGAELRGAFCGVCGTPAKAGEAEAPVAPTAEISGVPAAPRKTNPIVWILAAVAALFVLGMIFVVGAGFFVVHKVKQAGFDPQLMRNNPALASAKMLVAANPDLEIVSVDEATGSITIHQKSTNQTTTMNLNDVRRGRQFSYRAESGGQSFRVGSTPATLPAWMPAYPNSTPRNAYSMNGGGAAVSAFQFQTQDALNNVLTYYENAFRQNGFTITASTAGNPGSSGMVSAKDDAHNRTAMVTARTYMMGSTVSVTYSER